MVGTSEAQISRFYSRTHGVQKRLGFVKEGFIGTRWSVQKRSHGKTNLVNGTIAYRIWASASSSQGDRVENAHVSQMKSPSPDAIIQDDRLLETYREHLDYRIDQYNRTLTAIEMHEGSLEEFALGYRKFGFSREDGATVYREWAPGAVGAQLIGDFNDWSGLDMQKNEFGVWSVTIPDHANGEPALKHGSRVKIRLQHPGGWWLDRLPAWITWATVEPGKMGAKYDGIYWNPPKADRYVWKNERPVREGSLRIYEAHVGMSSQEETVTSYRYFADEVIPRVMKTGYNAIQLMAIQEHAYYASFGYHVTNPFAVSSRSGTPEDLKYLVDKAHEHGIIVLLDIVHSHISSNADDGLAGFDFGQGNGANYFLQGDAGYHRQWDSRLLDYGCYETLRYLISNVRYWLDEYRFDGFRFDGVTSMLYHHHGIDVGFSGNYNEYFSMATNIDAIVYLMLANTLVHKILPKGITIAEDVSGMPALCRSVEDGGVGFDYRLGMGLPDFWIRMLKHVRDEDWKMSDIVSTLCNRRYTEKTVGYAESHDQALVGDQTIAFRLMGADMYDGMSSLKQPSEIIQRGIALHKMIRTVTMVLGGEAYLNFMGNEFGHPEWIDFPREGNGWSYQHCRRQWNLVDEGHLRYSDLLAWDEDCLALDVSSPYISSPIQWVTLIDDDRQLLVAERGQLIFVFNFNPFHDYEGLEIPVPIPGKYRVALDSDALHVGGFGRVGHDVDHFTEPAESEFHGRHQYMRVLAPSRTVVAYKRIVEEEGVDEKASGKKGTKDSITSGARGTST